MKRLFQLMLPILLVTSCSSEKDRQRWVDWEPVANDHARFFQILRHGDNRLLLVFGPGGSDDTLGTYLISGAPVDGARPLPVLDRIVVATTTHLSFITALDREDVVAGAALLRDVRDPRVLGMISNGEITEVGTADGLDREQLVKLKPKAILDHPFNKQLQGDVQGIPVIHITEYLEEHPLGRAEWLKVFGLLLGEEERARKAFLAIADRYEERSATMRQLDKRPKVFFGSVWQGQWFAPAGNSYMATLINDAGGEYVFNGSREEGNITLDLEHVLHKVRRCDHFGMILSATSPVDHITLCNGETRLASIPSVEKGGFYGNSATSDLFGQALLEPDVILSDLQRIFHPTHADTLPPRYFQRIAQKSVAGIEASGALMNASHAGR